MSVGNQKEVFFFKKRGETDIENRLADMRKGRRGWDIWKEYHGK